MCVSVSSGDLTSTPICACACVCAVAALWLCLLLRLVLSYSLVLPDTQQQRLWDKSSQALPPPISLVLLMWMQVGLCVRVHGKLTIHDWQRWTHLSILTLPRCFFARSFDVVIVALILSRSESPVGFCHPSVLLFSNWFILCCCRCLPLELSTHYAVQQRAPWQVVWCQQSSYSDMCWCKHHKRNLGTRKCKTQHSLW